MASLSSEYIYFSDFDWSFTPNPKTGDITILKNEYSIKRSIKNLILTKYNERLFYSNKGSGLYHRLFEPFDEITASVIEDDIKIILRNNEPRLELQKVEVIPDYTYEGYEINIYGRIINTSGTVKIDVFLERIK